MSIYSYKKLTVWQKAIDLATLIYKLTEQFPKSELYGLVNQMRRASVSIASNIAEGQQRNNLKEYIQFLSIANGSVAELETQIIIAKNLYKNIDFSDANKIIIEIQKMLTVLIKNLKNKQKDSLTFNLKPKTSSGFSIIELLVAISLFVIIISMAVTIFLRALKTQKSALLLMESNDNVALAIEGMAREIRSGINFQSSGNDLEFLEVVSGNDIRYALSGGSLLKGVKSQVDPDFNYQTITSEGVEVKSFRAILDNSPNYPPKATIIISISPKNDALKNVTSDIQTTVSSREF